MSGNTAIRHCGTWWLLLMLAACHMSDPTLKPAASADQPSGHSRAATARVDGIHAVVESSSWPADPSVATKLTPLHVRIENHSDGPILLLYRKFALVGPESQYYSALPPVAARIDITGTTGNEALGSSVSTPSFHHQGFFVAPFYGHAYSPLPVWQHDFPHDPAYHHTYHASYEKLDISVEELSAWALPEGVIASNGSVSGYIYFEKTDSDLERVIFRAGIVNAITGQSLGTLNIPFTVERP